MKLLIVVLIACRRKLAISVSYHYAFLNFKGSRDACLQFRHYSYCVENCVDVVRFVLLLTLVDSDFIGCNI